MFSFVTVKLPLSFTTTWSVKAKCMKFSQRKHTCVTSMQISIRFCLFFCVVLHNLFIRLRMFSALPSLLRKVILMCFFFGQTLFLHLLEWFLSLKLLILWNIILNILMLKQPCDLKRNVFSQGKILLLYEICL